MNTSWVERIREAREPDLDDIRDIYNHAVLHGDATMDTVARTKADFDEWWVEHSGGFSVCVAESEEGDVAGYAALSPFSRRAGYAHLAETTVYIAPRYQRQGLGLILQNWCTETARTNGFFTLVSFISRGNLGSVKILEQNGYRKTGSMLRAGYKSARFIDLDIYQLFLVEDEA